MIDDISIRLTGGCAMEDWLRHETTLGLRAGAALREYRRFLTLALTAPDGTPTMPPPAVAQIWQIHRDDSAAWAKFLDTLPAPRLNHHAVRQPAAAASAYRSTLARYHATFGPPPRRWWPAPWMIRLRAILDVALWLLAGTWLGLFAAALASGTLHPQGALAHLHTGFLLTLLAVIALRTLLPVRFRIHSGPHAILVTTN